MFFAELIEGEKTDEKTVKESKRYCVSFSPESSALKLFTVVVRMNQLPIFATRGLYYKSFTIVIYNCNDSTIMILAKLDSKFAIEFCKRFYNLMRKFVLNLLVILTPGGSIALKNVFHFYIVKNNEIDSNSTTAEAR